MAELRIPDVSSETLDAACVAIDGRAVLIESRDAAARSELALCLIDRGAALVAAGPAICQRQGTTLLASAPADQAGRMPIAEIGVLRLDHAQRVPAALIVIIAEPDPRFPDPIRSRRIAGITLPVMTLAAIGPAAPFKVECALAQTSR